MPDTFPLLLKEGKLFYAVSHSSPKLKFTAMGQKGNPRKITKRTPLQGVPIAIGRGANHNNKSPSLNGLLINKLCDFFLFILKAHDSGLTTHGNQIHCSLCRASCALCHFCRCAVVPLRLCAVNAATSHLPPS
jgi:hypothetical protein